MAIPYWSCYHYRTVLHADRDGAWVGAADDDGSVCLLGNKPSVAVADGRVIITRRPRRGVERSEVSRASFDAGEVLGAVLREGDCLTCWRGPTAEIGLALTREGSLVLALGTLGRTPGSDITIHHDPRVEERELAGEIRYIDRPGTRIVWLDPDRPSEFEARLREIDGVLTGVNVLAIVVRTDDTAFSNELNGRLMGRRRAGVGATVFLTVRKQFSGVEEWLRYGRALSTERPRDLWLRIRLGRSECLVPEGTTAAVDGWIVHVLRVYEPGLPGQFSNLGVVRADTGVTPAILECSTAAVDKGLTFG
jgi:hypothetical protein